MQRPVSLLLLVLAPVYVLTACGRAEPTGSNDSARFDGTSWRVVRVSDGDAQRPVVAGTTISIVFAAGQLSVAAGCNTMSGRYQARGSDGLAVGALAATEMGCDQDRMEQDAWLADFFGDLERFVTTPEPALIAGDRVLVLERA